MAFSSFVRSKLFEMVFLSVKRVENFIDTNYNNAFILYVIKICEIQGFHKQIVKVSIICNDTTIFICL